MPEYSAGKVADYAEGDRKVVDCGEMRSAFSGSMANFLRGTIVVRTAPVRSVRDASCSG